MAMVTNGDSRIIPPIFRTPGVADEDGSEVPDAGSADAVGIVRVAALLDLVNAVTPESSVPLMIV